MENGQKQPPDLGWRMGGCFWGLGAGKWPKATPRCGLENGGLLLGPPLPSPPPSSLSWVPSKPPLRETDREREREREREKRIMSATIVRAGAKVLGLL